MRGLIIFGMLVGFFVLSWYFTSKVDTETGFTFTLMFLGTVFGVIYSVTKHWGGLRR